ncbi:Altronate dehydratase [Pseudovibrio sp. Ad46]|uniref:UxaA family hydrolase n=1 Tax=unclassified Pseudovibrio TaxID=2627060 RepID=UPI0007AE9063|nr:MULTISPECIES: altronate dehydratase family protein [unclassified Pseudovibrio]KZK88575.1 Altronate dehydratase [Pseudovibrio sp. Ad46]KZK91203.1 Altronate dehydratase [Pseudovibrio sp. Ad5]
MQIHRDDTVLVALKPFKKNEIVEGISLLQDIPAGHKIARIDIAEGEHVIKYGASIGRARSAIKCGEHIHSHNLKTGLRTDEIYTYSGAPEQSVEELEIPQIMAFERVNGNIGIRNDLWIVPLVGCVNGVAQAVARQFEGSKDLPDGTQVTVLAHPFGCSQLGNDHINTRTILQNLVMHPNAGGVLVMGLGCENNTLAEFLEGLEIPDPSRLRCMVAQDTENEIETAYCHLQDLAGNLLSDRRVPVGADRLRIGLKCGGSDGFSGITANPLLGALSDWLCSRGGTTVLTEVPEMFGAERILMRRAENQSVFAGIVSLINDFKQYYIDHDQPIYENPSPGNKDGGITTLEEKSLGCTQKAGTSIVTDVLRYQNRLSKAGLNLLEAPGNDGTAITSLAAAGCHMVLFTTGRGNPLGTVIPTVKVASNSEIADRKRHWIDFSAGTLVHDDTDMDDVCSGFADYLMQVAGGKQTLNEINRMQEIVIFKTGVTL